jgi:uncharacterized protein (TIGR02246 family)
MTVSLPKVIRAYFDGSNAHDPDAIAQRFTPDGVVHDEGKVHRGRAEIAAWARGTIDKYRTMITPLTVSESDDAAAVRAKVSGNFPGSPIELTFRFELSEGGIRALKIGT